MLAGKPIAVTHSKGKAAARDRPGTDLDYERAHWKRKGLKIRKGPAKGNLDPERNPDVLEMMEDDTEEEEKSSETTEAFNSMAEIASCSYEARKVR